MELPRIEEPRMRMPRIGNPRLESAHRRSDVKIGIAALLFFSCVLWTLGFFQPRLSIRGILSRGAPYHVHS